MDKNPSQAQIPRAAIRTMKKDLAGVVFEEWEEVLAESEVFNILNNFKRGTSQEDLALEEKKKEMEEMEEMERQKQLEEAERKKLEEEKIAQEKKEKEERLARERERKRKEEEERIIKEREREEELKIVAEIRKRAIEREMMIRERRKKEYEKKDEEEELKIIATEEQKKQEILIQKKQKIEAALNNLPEEKRPLDENKGYLLKEKDEISKMLDPILESERKIEENMRLIERQENAAIIPVEKRRAEKERQILEIEREKIEQERWSYEREHFKIDEQMGEIDLKYQELAQKEAKLMQALNDTVNEIKKYEKRREIKQEEKEIENITKEKNEIIKNRDIIVAQKRESEQALAETKSEEEKIERELDCIKQEEMVVKGTDKQRVEKERWKLERIRGELEKKKWRQEDEKRKLALEENRFNVRYQNLLEKENELRKNIDEINKFLGIVPVKKPEEMFSQEFKEKTSTEQQIETSDAPREFATKEEKEVGKEGEGIKNEKKEEIKEAEELLKKLEEKRKKEDLLKKLEGRRREDEQRKEEEILKRIRSGMTPQSSPVNVASKPNSSTAPPKPPVIVSPSFPEKKRWVKPAILIILGTIILGIIGFIIWQTRRPGTDQLEQPPEVINDEIPIPPTLTDPPVLWQELIPVEEKQSYQITNVNEIYMLLLEAYAQDMAEKEFIRIVFEDVAQNKFVGMNEFLLSIGIVVPGELYHLLDDNFTLYLYSENETKSLGFVAKKKPPRAPDMIIDPEETPPDLKSTMIAWESSLVANIQFLGLSLKKRVVERPTCRDGQNIRYCDLSENCFGVCYSIFNDYLIFGTCCNSVMAAKNLLKK